MPVQMVPLSSGTPPEPQPIFEYVPTLGDSTKATVRILSISGLNTIHGNTGSDRGRLFGTLHFDGTTYTLTLCNDIGQAAGSAVLTGTTTTLGTRFSLSAANGSGMSGAAIIDAYTADDATIVALPTFAIDFDVRRDPTLCSEFPGYDSTWGLSYFHADAMRTLLGSALPAALPHLFGSTGLAAFVPQQAGAVLPDLRKLANADQLRVAQADLAEALAARQGIHMPGFAEIHKEAMGRFDAAMQRLRDANVEEKIETIAEEAEDRAGISFGRFRRR